ncbi:NAD(P)H-quinone oxidoreductase subunit N [Halomicronema hongdechloris C2206]|uniref:NAD(P)H-quinone oxidoreductase subunit N n=1 Tax=Halomicronema hongdechloris C2206 TaxID=1641165 RepID=A0A1Z3HVH6_9CYAN|nr:NAD(P)H-quinone oxidoreductase subunit N [Halomicronema hongdechloris]ASC74318.1 NAD(P)H-quinone oxidoreductase subunit N [Halomicronema hongdechloris C2206]
MALLATGKRFIRNLETAGALAVQAPLEGGFEGRYQRRLRAAGYETMTLTARGLGDLASYLTGIHGVRPAHLGKKTVGQTAAVGDVYFVPPILTYRLQHVPPKAKGLVLWLIEGHILSRQEIEYLANLPSQETRIKIVLEVGGERFFSWQPLSEFVSAA